MRNDPTDIPIVGVSRRRASRRRHRFVVLLTATAVLLGTGASAANAALPLPKPAVKIVTASPDKAPGYQKQVSCRAVERPGPVKLRALLKRTYGKANAGGIVRACSTGGRSEHKEGRAYDWMLNARNTSDKAKADAFLKWLTGPDRSGVVGGNARRMGIQYVIWNKRWWTTWDRKWMTYTGPVPHTDHVHFSFTWDGAMARTSWWDGKAVAKIDHGPCVRVAGRLAPPYTAPNYSPCPKPRPAS